MNRQNTAPDPPIIGANRTAKRSPGTREPGPSRPRHARSRFGRAGAPWGLGLLSVLLAPALGLAGTPAGYTEYIIPFDEDVFVYVTDPLAFDVIPANRTTSSIISLTVWSDATTIYVDHWENGYGFDATDPDSTADERYTGALGETLNFVSDPIPRPRTGADGNTYVGAAGDCVGQAAPRTPDFRSTTAYCYDGRDYIYVAGGATTMTRGGWIEGSGGNTLGPRAAIGEEVYPLAPQLTKYVLPFGEGIGGSSYERVVAVIQATEDDTELRIDFDADGTYDPFNTENGYRTPRADPVDAAFVTLQRGETYVLDRDSDGIGGTLDKDVIILGTRTLQVEYFYGEDNGSYDTRAVAAYPRGFWGRNYYAVVDGAPGGADTDILVYNPDLANTITISWRTTVGAGSFTLGPRESALFETKTGAFVPEGSAVYLSGTDKFWGFSDIDVNSAAYDWGYSLVPDYLLEDEQTVAYAPGNIQNDDPLDFPPCNAAEGRDDGIFVTPAYDNTTFFIDKDGDGLPDVDASIEVLLGVTPVAATSSGGYAADRLETLYITGSNSGTTAASACDLTGARVWATGPFTMAYGENPEKASPGGGMDLGYTVLPNPADWMELVLTVDKSTDPVVLSTAAGATATFTLEVSSHEFGVESVSVLDTLPANWEYVPGSTTITLPNLTQLSGSAADPAVTLPALSWGSTTLGSLLTNQTITIEFQARTTAAFNNGDLTRNLVQATGTRTVGGVTQTFNARDFVFNTYQDTSVALEITKTSSVPEATPVSPGDTLTYTVVVSNPVSSSAPLTNVWINDPLPLGVSYVPGSGLIAGCVGTLNVRDQFGAVSYSNDDGSRNWSGPWAETDALGGGASSGNVRVTAGALRFTTVQGTVFVRDEFNTAGSGSGNDGSVNWSTNWTENDGGGLSGGDIEIEQGRIEFQDTTDGGEWIQRSANVSGATFATVSFAWADVGVDANDDFIVEYSLDGGGFTTLFVQDGSDAAGNYSTTVNFAGVTNFTLRFRAEDGLEPNEEAYFDNVQISYDGGAATGPAAGDRAVRSVDLTGATSATLSFSSLTSGTLDNPDVFQVRVNTTNSLAGSTLLESVIDDNAFAGSYDITPFISATTTVFFVVSGGIDAAGEWRSFDDVDITYTAPASAFASGDPPDFLSGSDACSVGPGGAVTLTFDVTVDDPFPTGLSSIVNTASSAATEIPVPQSASARNIVVVPSTGSATVGDRVWLDADGDGVLDPGESGLPGVEVTLRDQWGTPLQLTTTDGQGRYLFVDVEPGVDYFVEVTGGLPAGLTQTTDGRTDLRTNDFDLTDGLAYVDADLGFRASANTASIGDTVWLDIDQDMLRDPGEVGLAGVTVELYRDVNGDGQVGPADVLVSSQLTAAGGTYLFTGIPADGALDYVVITAPGQAALGGYLATTATIYAYPDLASGATRVDADFGFVPTAAGSTYTIADGVWLDDGAGGGTADDGVRNGAEAGLAGVTVALLDSGGNAIASTTTDASGSFAFTGVLAGQNYSWRITDDDNVLADLYGTTSYAVARLEQLVGNLTGDLVHTANPHFGYDATRAIGDTVWNDLDGDGVQSSGEPGIAGVTVLLYRDVDGDGVFEPGTDDGSPVGSLVTSGTGFYLFAGLADGTWFVSIDGTQATLTGFTLTTGDQEPAAGDQREVVLSGGASQLGEDYGYRATISFGLSGRLWDDQNDNGADDAEAGFGNVTLELVSGGSVIATTTSAPDGSYGFQGLPNGTYTVRFTDLNGVLTGFQTTFEKTEGALASSYDGQETATLSGASIADLDFGFYNPFRALTLAVVSSFAAFEESGSVVIEWETSAEIGTIGFDLYRFDGPETGYVLLNDELLPALIGSQQGGTYRYVDEAASPGRPLWYLLVEVEASGRRNPMGPYQVDTDSTLYSGGSEGRREALGRQLARRFAKVRRVTRPRHDGWRRPGGRKRPDRPSPSGRPRAKVATSRQGVYYLPQSALAEAGLGGWPGFLSLTRGGQAVAWAASPDASGIYFYAPGLDSESHTSDVYQLRRGRGGVTMEVRRRGRPAPRGDETFVRSLRMEQDLLPSPQLFTDADADWTLWEYLFGGWPAKAFAFRADGATRSGTATLTLRLHGGNDTEVDPDHHVILRLNGQRLGELSWDGLAESVTTHSFDASLLVEGENSLEIEALADTGAWYSLVYLDSFDISYESFYRATDGRLACSTSGNRAILISGFTRPDILVLDVSDPGRPVKVEGEVRQLADGSFGVALAAPARDRDYYALTPDALLGAEVSADTPSDLRSTRNAAEYLVITTDELMDAAQVLADYHGMRSMVVDIEDVYDEFNHGLPSPRALKAFLTHAWTRWALPPRYVVLAGNGTFDYATSYPYGDNLIPPMMVPTPDGLAPSDVWFADLDPSGPAPELAIGRLPASSPEELLEIVRKIQAREELGSDWLRRFLLAADNADSKGAFPADSDRLAALAPTGFQLERVYLSTLPVAAARQRLLAGINQGTGMVSYVGHAGYDVLADEGLLRSRDLALLVNGERPTVLTAMTCIAGNFASPFIPSIGEQLVQKPGGGAAAVWAPTWMSENDHAVALAESYYGVVFSGEELRIGDAVLAAMRAYAQTPRPRYLLYLYTLLGDPAMSLAW